MKNRDHSLISSKGRENLEKARLDRSIPLELFTENSFFYFISTSEAARFISNELNVASEKVRYKLRNGVNEIDMYHVNYLKKEYNNV